MTFLNASLLAGAAAFLIPLLIHLLNKRKVQTVPWGAMHLLQEVIRQRKRRWKIEQWLLLAVRIAIPILLALCLARPALTALRAFGLGKSSLVVLLDDSFSMKAPSASGTPTEQARQDISRILDTLPKGSDTQVILAGGSPRPLLHQPTTALDLLPQELLSAPTQSGPVQANEAIQASAATLSKASQASRELAIISDFQSSDWKAIAEGAALPALEALTQQEPKPQITFYRVSSDLKENLSISTAELSALVVAAQQPIGLRVRVKNHGARPWQDVAIHLEADGSRLRTSRIHLPANGETALTFTHAFAETGDHSLAVRIEGDSFLDDNAFYTIVQVRQQLNVLLVEGDPSTIPLGGAVDFLEIALTPYQATENPTLKDLIRTTKVEDRRLRDDDLRGKEVVILADIERLRSQMANLEKFVKAGGGLIIFAGPHADLAWYQKDFYRQGQGLFPVQISGLQHAAVKQPARLLQQRLTHPAMLYFNDTRAGRLQDAEFQSWWEFQVTPPAQPLLQLDRGTPLIVEKAYERGRVIAVASTADAEWSNLPLQPFFVPLMQRLVTHLATQSTLTAWNLVGAPLRIPLNKDRLGTEYTLKDPTGQILKLTAQAAGDQVFVESPALSLPGIYELRQGAEARLLAYNLDTQESDLTPLPSEQVQQIAQRHQAAYVEDFSDWQKVDRTRRHGSELWQPLLLALLAFLFIEVLLQQRISST